MPYAAVALIAFALLYFWSVRKQMETYNQMKGRRGEDLRD